MTNPNVAFCRGLKRGDTGNDVVAHKRAISRAFPDLYPWWAKGFTPLYGQKFEDAVKGAQLIMKLPTTGKIDKATHEALERRRQQKDKTEWAFDDYAIHLADQYCKNFDKKTVREKIVEAAFFWYAHRMQTQYSMARPYPLIKPPQVADKLDCSGLSANCHYAAGVPGITRIEYTGSLLAKGHKVSFGDLEPGDFIFYGFSSGRPGFPTGAPTHVAVYVGKGMVVSNGHYPMGYYHYNYRSDINCYVHYNL